MRTAITSFAVVALATVSSLASQPPKAAPAGPSRALIVTSQDHSLVEVENCQHFHTQTASSFPSTATSQEERDVPLAGIDLLKVRASQEGGVSIKGWDRNFVRLTVCKSAVALNDAQAQKALGEISVSFKNGEIVAAGPETDESQAWWAHMILRVPKSATLDVASLNGGIAIRNMNGKVTARAKNGGISLASCAGANKVTTENGGISIEKIAGTLEAITENGPISLKLRNLKVPSIEARTEEAGTIICNLKGCADRLGNWNSNRKVLRIGQTPSIKLTTLRAPITIEQVR